MPDNNNDIEPSDPIIQQNESPSKTPYMGLNRRLTDEDYATPGVQKLIVNRIDELLEEKANHEQKIYALEKLIADIREKYHNTNINLAIYKEKFKKQSFWEIFETITLMIGSTLIGFVSNSHLGIVIGIFAFVLIALSIIGKAFLYNDTKREENE